MNQAAGQENVKAYKAIIIVLAIGIVIVGGLFAFKTFAPGGSGQTMEVMQQDGNGEIAFSADAATAAPEGTVYKENVEKGEATEGE